MPDPAVNASPLVILARARRLDLLRLVGDRILVPQPVVAEIRAYSDEAGSAIERETWIVEVPPLPVAEIVAAWDLGAGESAVLSLALGRPDTLAVIDDYAARKCAAAIGVRVKGTLGLALLAKARGHVPQARLLVDELRQAGLYLSDSVIREALELVGE